MKLPIKWKLFLAANYLLLVFCLLLVGVQLYLMIERPYREEFELMYILFLSAFLFFAINFVTNLYISHKFFPDSPVSKAAKFFFDASPSFTFYCLRASWRYAFLACWKN